MDEKTSEVVLLGSWVSSYCTRIELALKLKGIPYKFVEEDLKNKSDLLLQNNPVHKKIPVLLHKGKPICESLIILEYIDEVWSHSPKLLPEDPYQRAKISPGIYPILLSKGEERKKAIEEMDEMMKVFEEGVKEGLDGQFPLYKGQTLGFLDIVVGAGSCNYEAFHEACNIEVTNPQKSPKFFEWVNSMKEHPLMKQTLPPHDKLVSKIKDFIP
ncbi:Thioredoxin-like superfamily [Sesbania bispinosa]|nr:Thioredoxin-like superfamily [Sesbania bispinosa]